MICSLKNTGNKIILPLKQYISLARIYPALNMNPKAGCVGYVTIHFTAPYIQILIINHQIGYTLKLVEIAYTSSYSRANELRSLGLTRSRTIPTVIVRGGTVAQVLIVLFVTSSTAVRLVLKAISSGVETSSDTTLLCH